MTPGAEHVQPLLLWGASQHPNQRIALRAGLLSCVFEPETAFLRYVSCGRYELIRAVYAAVRGPGWVTIPPHISAVSQQRDSSGISLSFRAACKAPPVWFEWNGVIRLSRNGTIVFSFDGIARSSFQRNRIGFCILHPDTCAGQPCIVEHVDGTITRASFPLFISPHQPFFNIRAISHTLFNGIETHVCCNGDVFEMEDQRNWTDASFKTYCTPLALPAPVEIAAGTRIQQTITITVRAPKGAATRVTLVKKRVRCFVGEESRSAPLIGLGLPWGGTALDETARKRVLSLAPAHLRCELHLADARWRDEFHHAQQAARLLGTPLELALVLPELPDQPLTDFVTACSHTAPRVARCFVFAEGRAVPSQEAFSRAARILNTCIPPHLIGTGTNRYFTELNRSRPPLNGPACIAYSCNPQVHTFDNASIAETFSGQAWTVRTAQTFCNGLPIHVSPVTLKPRPTPSSFLTSSLPPAWADQRQASLFGLAFALGSVAHLAHAGATGITLFDVCGWNGIMDDAHGGWLRHLCGQPGVYPVYHLLADLADCAGYQWYDLTSEDPRRVVGLACVHPAHNVILLANLTAEPLTVSTPCLQTTVHVRSLDATTLHDALFNPSRFRASFSVKKVARTSILTIPIPPNAYIRIDIH